MSGDQEVISAVVKLEDETDDASQSAKQNLDGMFQSYVDVSSALHDVAAAAKKAWDFMAQRVEQASVQERAELRVQSALQATNQYTAENMEFILRQADALQRKLAIGDEEILQQQALALALGANVSQLEDMSVISAGAAAVGLDQATAMRGLAQSLQGNVNMLGRYFPALREFTEEQLKGGAAVEYMREQVGGLADVEMQTAAGRYRDLQNAIGDVNESVGSFITQHDTVQALLTVTTDRVHEYNEGLQQQQDAYSNVIQTGIFAFVDGLGVIQLVYGKTKQSGAQFMAVATGMWATVVDGGAYAVDALFLFGRAWAETMGRIIGQRDELIQTFDRVSITIHDTADDFARRSGQWADDAAKIGASVEQNAAEVQRFKDDVRNLAWELSQVPPAVDQTAASLADLSLVTGDAAADIGDVADEIDDVAQQALKMEANHRAAAEGMGASWQSAFQSVTSLGQSTFSKIMAAQEQYNKASREGAANAKAVWKGAMKSIMEEVLNAVASMLIAKAIETFANIVAGESQKGIAGAVAGIAFGGALMATMMAMKSEIPAAAQGGVVQGSPRGQDNQLVWTHPGEAMIPDGLRAALVDALTRPVGSPASLPVSAAPSSPSRAPASGGVVDARGQQGGMSGRPEYHVHVDAPADEGRMREFVEKTLVRQMRDAERSSAGIRP